MRLNCGCGNVPLPGFINIDKYYYPSSTWPLTDQRAVDAWVDTEDSKWIYGDATNLDFPENTFDEVMMVHCLEHLDMEEGNLAIREIYKVLKVGGSVDIELPNLVKACELLLKTSYAEDTQKWYRVMGLLYGTTGSDGEGQYHMCGYTPEYLRFKLEERGFKDIQDIPVGFGHGEATFEGHGEPEYDFRLRGVK